MPQIYLIFYNCISAIFHCYYLLLFYFNWYKWSKIIMQTLYTHHQDVEREKERIKRLFFFSFIHTLFQTSYWVFKKFSFNEIERKSQHTATPFIYFSFLLLLLYPLHCHEKKKVKNPRVAFFFGNFSSHFSYKIALVLSVICSMKPSFSNTPWKIYIFLKEKKKEINKFLKKFINSLRKNYGSHRGELIALCVKPVNVSVLYSKKKVTLINT